MVGDTIACERCSIDTIRLGRGTKYCPACAEIRRAETFKTWRERHPDRVYEIGRASDERRRTDPKRQAWARAYSRLRSAKIHATPRGQVDHAMSTLVRLNMNTGRGRILLSLVGYSPAELRIHIERQFLAGMSWDNMKEWHIDHILPKSMFDYRSPADDAFKACWALTNLRPLWKQANIKKSAKRTHLL